MRCLAQRKKLELADAHQVRFAWVFRREDKAAVQRLQDTLAIHRQFNELWDAREATQKTAQTVREQTQKADAQDQTVLQQVRGLAAYLGQHLGPFTVADVTAYWRAWGFALPEARQLTADTLRLWHREGLIHIPQGLDPDSLFRTVERGITGETRLQQQVWSHAGKIVSDDLLKREIAIAHTAQTLARTHRRALAVDVTGLTPDQARAASLIAEGRALTTIQGVAGAGKSYLLKPIVQAAQRRPRQPMDVLVLARNAKLAGELGSELGVKSSTLARFRHRQQPITRPTLLIVDEAGLVDQTDWQAILDTAQQNPHVQLVAVGDRLQAQPIDRLATWAVISQAAQNVGAYAELSQSFRNRAWIDEATALRAGSPAAAQMAATSQRLFTAPDGHSAAWTAQLVLKLRERGEDALAIAATNEEAAEIATQIQHLRGIQPDPRTTLRWAQRTGLGDIVRTRKNERAAKIHNGDVWTVTAIDNRRLTLQAPDGRRASIPHQWAKDHLELAYAATVDSAQGVTVDRAVVALSPLMGRTRLYSAATRGRQAPAYVADRQWGPAITQLEAAIGRDDLSQTMHEILQVAHADLHRDLTRPLHRDHGLGLER